jgi:hypothetical protein
MTDYQREVMVDVIQHICSLAGCIGSENFFGYGITPAVGSKFNPCCRLEQIACVTCDYLPLRLMQLLEKH